jgi:hypothetical protein
MTKLCELILECRAIKGMDRFVLYGWAAQLVEGNDTLYCSKETVADFIGTHPETVFRRTKALIKSGWIIDTGEQKQWPLARTPVRIINVPMLVSGHERLTIAPPQNAVVNVEASSDRQGGQIAPPQIAVVNNATITGIVEAPPQVAPPQFAVQGSYGSTGSRFTSFSSSLTCTAATATGVPPVAVVEARQSKSKEPWTCPQK